jgi:hypothetical protein
MVHRILIGLVAVGQRSLGRLVVLPLPVLLRGCLRYDLTLRFYHHTHGQILQTMELSDRGAALAQPTLAPWLEDLKARSRPLGGQLSQGPQTVTLAVPFGTAADLVQRFTQVFAVAESAPDAVPGATTGVQDGNALSQGPGPRLELAGWGVVPFELAIDQRNWGLASRTHLTYVLDLQDLPANGDGLTDTAPPWADLRLRLQVPWGLAENPQGTPPITQDVTGATWQLQPGQLTRIDVVFWLPNAVALGTLGIVALVLGGYGLRYRVLKQGLGQNVKP